MIFRSRSFVWLLMLLAPSAFADAPAPIDVRALLDEALAANPGLLAARARARAADHAPSQAEAPPDPVVSLAYTNESLDRVTLGSSDMSNLSLSWSQEVLYPGKRRLAGELAHASVGVATTEIAADERAVTAGVKRAYVELFRVDRTREILEQSRGLLESLRDAARGRYETGGGILENVLRAQAEITRLDVELETLFEARASAAADLNAAVGRPASSPLGIAREPLVAVIPDEAALEAALERSPALLTRQAAARREEARVALAERNLKPDFVWSAAYMNRGGLDPMVMGMFGLRLPLFRDRKQGEAVAQAREDLTAAQAGVDAGRLQVMTSMHHLVVMAARARSTIRLYDEGVVPQSRGALDAARAAYAGGRAEFSTVVADFLALLDAERALVTQRADEASALADLEALTGIALLTPAEEERHD